MARDQGGRATAEQHAVLHAVFSLAYGSRTGPRRRSLTPTCDRDLPARTETSDRCHVVLKCCRISQHRSCGNVRRGEPPATYMANTPVQPGATPAPKSLVARFIGIITAPRATFESVVAHPKWFGMLALTTVASSRSSRRCRLTTEAGQQARSTAGASDGVVRHAGERPDVPGRCRSGCRLRRTRPRLACSSSCPSSRVIIAGILFAIFNAAMGGTATFKQVFTVVRPRRALSAALGQLFTGPLNYFRGTMSSATNLSVLLPMLTEESFAARLLGMIDLFMIWWLIVLSMGLAVLYRRRTQPIAMSLLVVYAVIAVVVALDHEPSWGNDLSRKKKILIGVGIVLVLGAIAFANVKFKRTEGIERHHRSRSRSGTSRRSCPPPARSSRSATSTSAPTRWAGSPIWRSNEGDRVTKGQFLLQIDPRNLRTAVQRTEASLAAVELAGRTAARRDRERQGRAEAGAGQLHAPAGPVEGRADDARDARARRERAEAAAGGPASRRSSSSRRSSCAWSRRARRPRAPGSI